MQPHKSLYSSVNENSNTYLVTGGAGFIGSHLVDRLLKCKHNVIVIDDLSSGYKNNLPNNIANLLIQKKVQDVANDDIFLINGIFHLAAQSSVPYSIDNYFESSKNNIISSLKVYEWAKNHSIPIVYASSSAVYGNLSLGDDMKFKYNIISPYAQDKLSMEDYAKMCWHVYQMPSIGLRFFNVYGPRQDPNNHYSGVISIFIDRLMKNKMVTVNGGYQTRDFIFVNDVVEVMVKSMEYICNKRLCEVLNVGTGKSITIKNLLAMLADIMKVKPEIILKELPPEDPEQSSGTYEKLKNILNIDINQFIKLEEGLRSTVEFLTKNQSQ